MRTVKQRWKTLAFAAMMVAGLGYSADASAAAKLQNAIGVKTNTGKFFPVVRVSMMVVADGASTFEIVLKDGEGEANVESISFEKHEEMIDFELYRLNSDGTPYLDMMKPSWLITSTGKFFKTMDVTNMLAKEGSDRFDVVTTNGTEYDVAYVYFLRNTEDFVKEYIQTGTTVAQVYSVDGKLQTEAAVLGGNTTIQVGHLPAGVYVVRVGNKSLKFSKK